MPKRSAIFAAFVAVLLMTLATTDARISGATIPGAVSVAEAACDPTPNPIVCENQLAGAPSSQWSVSGAGDVSIQGFATDISINRGSTVHFKINTPASNYFIVIYRMGYYGGAGAHQVAVVLPSAQLPQSQPACLTNGTVGPVDCGNWAESASWAIPATATSGIYFAKLIRADTGGASHIVFVIRDDASTSPLLFQTSDTTWTAYNAAIGPNLYSAPGQTAKVSYNRPFGTASSKPESWVFNAEYPMVRWLEQNGYNVSYFSGVDSDRNGSLISNHRVFLSVGHDEYWSGNQRANVEAARAKGVNLGFFSANAVFWKTRYENSTDGSHTPYRTLVTYKETEANAVIDPLDPPTWTGSWRDPRFSPPADGGRPENALIGTIFMVDGPWYEAMQIPAEEGKLRFWRNTSVASLNPGDLAIIGAGCQCLLGYEWDEDLDNGARRAGLVDMSTSTYSVGYLLQDYGSVYRPGTATHRLTLYRSPSGALVFSAGTVGWAYGLDSNSAVMASTPDSRIQQATVNLMADMGVQPGTLQTGLIAATASTDFTPPSSVITSPSAGASVTVGTAYTVTGTAADTGGGLVGGVEISLDGGSSWHPVTGRSNWTYNWTPPSAGAYTLRTRAADDSGNLENPGAGISVNAINTLPTPTSTPTATPTPLPGACPCTLWSGSTVPNIPNSSDVSAVELGVKFTSDVSGSVTGVRFYKGPSNIGTHAGSIWTSSGTLLATATFTGESASGWQQVTFSSPVTITANTVYVASYHANGGRYSIDYNYFGSTAFDHAPLHAPSTSTSGGNGVYAYAGTTIFPANSYNGSNYWVDVVFSPGASPTATPTPTATSTPTPGGATSTPTPTATSTPTLTPTTVPTSTPTATPTSLPGACPCTLWSNSATPAIANQNDSGSIELGVKFTSSSSGFIAGIRFYKGALNTGAHTGNLWSSTGTLLATATFSGESASGWQQVTFASPVAITANIVYVASYHAAAGQYSVDYNYFNVNGIDRAPLHAPSSPAGGGNGVYVYSGASVFPTNTYNGSNYWVDAVFTP